MPSRTSGAADRRSIATNAASSSSPAARVTAVRATGTSGADTTAYTSSTIATVRTAAPVTSNPAAARSGRPSRGISRTASARITEAISTGAKNTQRQSAAVSSPPVTMPREKPPAAVPA